MTQAMVRTKSVMLLYCTPIRNIAGVPNRHTAHVISMKAAESRNLRSTLTESHTRSTNRKNLNIRNIIFTPP